MIQREFYTQRKDGVKLYRTYSDAGMMIRQNETGAINIVKGYVGLGKVRNEAQYSAQNPPPYPVTSVNGHTGSITIREVPDVTISDNGKFLRVVNGSWAVVAIADANGVKF